MISRLHRRALLQWLAATGLSLPVLVDAPFAAEADDATQDLEAFLDAFHGAGWSHVTPITYVADGSGAIVAALRGHQTLDALLTALP